MFMKDLYYPPKPKSKLEEYNQKLKERELYTNNILDRFIENGSGAPKHDQNGNLITRRRNFLNENNEDIMYRQQLQTPSTQINNNSNKNSLNNTFSNKYNQNQNNISNFQFYQSFNNKSSTTKKKFKQKYKQPK